MLVGHFAAGFAGKRVAPDVSLGTLMAAALFLDLLVFVDQLLGLEHARVTPHITAFSSLDGYDIAISHSLAMAFVWSILLGLAYMRWRQDRRGSLVISLAVFSHWILDLVSHRPELPLAPGVEHYLGLGLWNSITLTFTVEGALWVLGIILYVQMSSPKNRGAVLGLLVLVAIPTIAWIRTPSGMLRPGDFGWSVLLALLLAHVGLCTLAGWVDACALRRDRRARVIV